MSTRRELIKPDDRTLEQWKQSLLAEKTDILRQMRREIHTRGNQHQSYLNRIDCALARIEEGRP